jgi:hypothetical protein
MPTYDMQAMAVQIYAEGWPHHLRVLNRKTFLCVGQVSAPDPWRYEFPQVAYVGGRQFIHIPQDMDTAYINSP